MREFRKRERKSEKKKPEKREKKCLFCKLKPASKRSGRELETFFRILFDCQRLSY